MKKKLNYYKLLWKSFWFNLHYFPLKQAIKVPIFIYNPIYVSKLGKVKIEGSISRGMIRLGRYTCPMYNKGIKWENKGTIIFKGNCSIGNESFISVGKNGILTIGKDFANTGKLNIICIKNITIDDYNRFGWETLIMDTSFHPLFDKEKEIFLPAIRPVHIGAHNWLGLQCVVMPGADTPDYCIFGLRSIITRNASIESYCAHAGNPLKVIRRNVERILGKDQIEY